MTKMTEILIPLLLQSATFQINHIFPVASVIKKEPNNNRKKPPSGVSLYNLSNIPHALYGLM